MKISLKKFESEIDRRIVSRGEEYFDNDAVRGLKKIKNDQWAAAVDGTETYKVCINAMCKFLPTQEFSLVFSKISSNWTKIPDWGQKYLHIA